MGSRRGCRSRCGRCRLEQAAPDPWSSRPAPRRGRGRCCVCRLPGGALELRFVESVEVATRPVLALSHATLRFGPPLSSAPASAEIVEATLELDDGDGRAERHEGLALGGAHPRRIAAVLCAESELVYPGRALGGVRSLPASAVPERSRRRALPHGRDGYGDLVPEDFFDADWVLGDQGPAAGVHAVARGRRVATLVVPDLYEPSPLPALEDVLDPPTLAGPSFAKCVEPERGARRREPPELAGLLLDPNDPSELDAIVGYQRRLAGLAEATRAFVVLLDVPPGLDQRRIVRWRSTFATSYAAAYHPWLDVVRSDDRRDAKVSDEPVGLRGRHRGRPRAPAGRARPRAGEAVTARTGPARPAWRLRRPRGPRARRPQAQVAEHPVGVEEVPGHEIAVAVAPMSEGPGETRSLRYGLAGSRSDSAQRTPG